MCAEFHRLLNIERENQISGVSGDGVEDLNGTEPKASSFIQHRDFDEGDDGQVADSGAGVGRGERASRGLSEAPWIGKVPENRMSVGDETGHPSFVRPRRDDDKASRTVRHSARDGTLASENFPERGRAGAAADGGFIKEVSRP